MTKKNLKSNTVSYFNLKSSKKKTKSPSRSPESTKRSKSDESKGKNLKKSQQETKKVKRSKSVEVPKTNQLKPTSQQNNKKPLRTGNIPHSQAKKKEEPLPKDLFEARFRGKKILVFKNSNDGHLIEEPLPLAVSEHSYPTFESLLNHLNQKITLRTGRINKLYKIQGGEITEVKQLRDKGWYVASTGLYVPEGAIEKVGKKYHKEEDETIRNNLEKEEEEEEIEKEISKLKKKERDNKSQLKTTEKKKHVPTHVDLDIYHRQTVDPYEKPAKKPPVPKFPVKKAPSYNKPEVQKPKPILKPILHPDDHERLEVNFGRKGTLGHHIRSHSASSPTFGKRKNKSKSDVGLSEDVMETETEVYARPLSRSVSNQNFGRQTYNFEETNDYPVREDEFQTTSPYTKTRESPKYDNNYEFQNNYEQNDYDRKDNQDWGGGRESRSNNRRQSGSLGYLRRSSAKQMEPEFSSYKRQSLREEFQSSKRQSLRDENYDEDELVYEPSEIEPINKVMYPTGFRPPSRKDAANSARAIQRDAANSPKARDAANSAKSRLDEGTSYTRPPSRDPYQQKRNLNELKSNNSGRNNGRSNSAGYNNKYENEDNGYEGGQYGDEYEKEDFTEKEPQRVSRSVQGSPYYKQQPSSRDRKPISKERRPKSVDNELQEEKKRKISNQGNKNSDKYDFSITVRHSRQ